LVAVDDRQDPTFGRFAGTIGSAIISAVNVQTEIPAALILMPLVVILIVVGFTWLRRTGRLTPARGVTVAAAAVYLAGVLNVTTLPLHIALGVYANQIPWYEKLNVIPILVVDPRTFVLNIVMTVPLGVLLPLLTRIRGVRSVALAGLAFSAAIEIFQLLTNTILSSGDLADVNDLLANTLGTVAGYLLLTRVTPLAHLSERFRTAPVTDPRAVRS
jgi:glycopeptide antibiotics resistance protein